MSSSKIGGSDDSDWKTVTSKIKGRKNKRNVKKIDKTLSPQRVFSRSGRKIINASHDKRDLCSIQDCPVEAAAASSKCVVISCNR
jgi:hypothetical protein